MGFAGKHQWVGELAINNADFDCILCCPCFGACCWGHCADVMVVLDNAYYGLKLVNCKISWIGLRVAIFGLLMYFYSEYPPGACSICLNV